MKSESILKDPVTEALVIAAEECAEVQKEIAKAQRFGLDAARQDTLAHELGQLQAMIEILKRGDVIPEGPFFDGYRGKGDKLKVWSNLPKRWIDPNYVYDPSTEAGM